MNELLRDTAIDAIARYPDAIEAALEDGFAVVSALNATGSLLVTGCNNGRARVCLLGKVAVRLMALGYLSYQYLLRYLIVQRLMLAVHPFQNPFAFILYVLSSSLTRC